MDIRNSYLYAVFWKSFRRNRRQYRSIVLSLTLSVVLFVVGCTFSDTAHRIGEQGAFHGQPQPDSGRSRPRIR